MHYGPTSQLLKYFFITLVAFDYETDEQLRTQQFC